MYRLREFLQNIVGIPAEVVSSDYIYCSETDAEKTLLTNQMKASLAAYSYTLVRQGWLSLVYNGKEITLQQGDVYIYSPGFQVTILGASENYKAMCLIADDQMTLESPAIWNMIRTAYYPIAEFGQPVVHLNETQAAHMLNRMQEIESYLGSNHRFLKESLQMLHTLFVLDLRNIMEQTIRHPQYGERTTDLFVRFIRLLPQHFAEHHNIGFYAGELCVTTTHLSRIVRQMTGRTVVDYINQMLLMEASWLLQKSNLPIAVVAERLHFADQSSFSKFFTRMKGVSPKTYRR